MFEVEIAAFERLLLDHRPAEALHRLFVGGDHLRGKLALERTFGRQRRDQRHHCFDRAGSLFAFQALQRQKQVNEEAKLRLRIDKSGRVDHVLPRIDGDLALSMVLPVPFFTAGLIFRPLALHPKGKSTTLG